MARIPSKGYIVDNITNQYLCGYDSENCVLLTDFVDPKYLSIQEIN